VPVFGTLLTRIVFTRRSLTLQSERKLGWRKPAAGHPRNMMGKRFGPSMRQDSIIHIDDHAHRRFRLFWLWFGCFFSLTYLGGALFHDPVASCREIIFTTPLLDGSLIACVISFILVFVMMRRTTRLCRTSFLIGWVHACSLLYLALCVASLAHDIFYFSVTNIIQSANTARDLGHEHLQTVFVAITRGLALYFICVTVLYVASKERKFVGLPPVEFYCVFYPVLWLALSLAWRCYW